MTCFYIHRYDNIIDMSLAFHVKDCMPVSKLPLGTDNPLYTDNDKIRYNDNLTVTKPSLMRNN